MGKVLIILIIFFAVLYLGPMIFRRWIYPWFVRCANEKFEDFIRKSAGLPPRPRKSGPFRRPKTDDADSPRTYGARRRQAAPRHQGPIIPKEYAVDVEFTEIKEYSTQVEINGVEAPRDGWRKKSASQKVIVESQVSDVEFTEIKINR